MLVLSSFDRFCSSSSSTRIRSIANTHIAKWIIVSTTLVSFLYMSPMLIILNYDATLKLCTQYLDTISYAYTLSQLIVYYVLSSLLLVIFGLGTIFNIRQQKSRTQATGVRPNRGRRTEGQLARTLILQLLVHFILTLPYAITYCMNALIPSTRTTIILAIRQIAMPWFQCDFFVFFFLYIVAGSIYRQELMRLLKWKRRRQIDQAPTQME